MNIDLIINEPNFEYDTQTLIKAFYSEADVIIYNCGGEGSGKADITVRVSYIKDLVRIRISVSKDNYDNEQEFPVDYSNRKDAKNRIKRGLYDMLQEITGRILPWGTLTGIRPTKIPSAFIEVGSLDDDALYEYMRRTYYTSPEKTKLAIDIAHREHEILQSIDYENGYSLYIGIPFCPTTCLYCSFTSYPICMYRKKTDAYIDAMFKEMDYVAQRFKDRHLNSVYIGGGTPTTLEAWQLDRILTHIEEVFDMSNCREFTVEAGRPDSITEDKLLAIKNHMVTRISINPQTMIQKTLDIIGRKHTVEQVKSTYALARSLGFDNINMDFIVGLPDEDIDDVRYSMEEALKLNPDSLTVHSLAIKRAARLNMFKDEYKELSFENNQEIMALTADYAEKMCMKPYYLYRQKNMAGNMENVGYSKLDKAGIYNILIMEEKQTIVAIGAGSSTKYVYPDGERIERNENVKNVDEYISRIDEMISRKESFFDEHDSRR